ncbi:hypothetical protein VDG1235_1790 [Verrucomicrobiia bacterium DG1235]|nr:hypothetical protein VDG1235_1790 [Verrucomicrobiae bacterium DG1235]
MNQQALIANARRKALRERRKREGAFSRDDLLSLQVSTVPRWKRIVVSTFGLCSLIGGIIAMIQTDSWILASLFIAFGLMLIYIGAFKRKKTIDSALNGIDAGTTTNILDAIWDAL